MKESSKDLNKSKSRGLKSSYPKYNSRSSNHVQMEKTERIINSGRLSAKNTQKVWPRRNNQQNIWKLLINLPSNISRDRSLLEALQNEGISTAGTCKNNKAVTETLNDLFEFVFSTVFHTDIVCDQLQLEWDSNSEQKWTITSFKLQRHSQSYSWVFWTSLLQVRPADSHSDWNYLQTCCSAAAPSYPGHDLETLKHDQSPSLPLRVTATPATCWML